MKCSDVINDAIAKGEDVVLTYRRGKETEARVTPERWASQDGVQFLIGFDREENKKLSYRLDRIVRVIVWRASTSSSPVVRVSTSPVTPLSDDKKGPTVTMPTPVARSIPVRTAPAKREASASDQAGSTAEAVHIRIWGDRALWAIPHLKADPVSYAAPPPSQLAGFARALYWKPEFELEVTQVVINNPICYRTQRFNGPKKFPGGRGEDITQYTVTSLVDVDYTVSFRIARNPHRGTRDAHAYLQETRRRLHAGQSFREPCLGRRSYTAWWELVDKAPVCGIPMTEDLGRMVFELDPIDMTKDRWAPRFWSPRIENGVIHVPESLYATRRPLIFAARHEIHPDRQTADVEAE